MEAGKLQSANKAAAFKKKEELALAGRRKLEEFRNKKKIASTEKARNCVPVVQASTPQVAVVASQLSKAVERVSPFVQAPPPPPQFRPTPVTHNINGSADAAVQQLDSLTSSYVGGGGRPLVNGHHVPSPPPAQSKVTGQQVSGSGYGPTAFAANGPLVSVHRSGGIPHQAPLWQLPARPNYQGLPSMPARPSHSSAGAEHLGSGAVSARPMVGDSRQSMPHVTPSITSPRSSQAPGVPGASPLPSGLGGTLPPPPFGLSRQTSGPQAQLKDAQKPAEPVIQPTVVAPESPPADAGSLPLGLPPDFALDPLEILGSAVSADEEVRAGPSPAASYSKGPASQIPWSNFAEDETFIIGAAERTEDAIDPELEGKDVNAGEGQLVKVESVALKLDSKDVSTRDGQLNKVESEVISYNHFQEGEAGSKVRTDASAGVGSLAEEGSSRLFDKNKRTNGAAQGESTRSDTSNGTGSVAEEESSRLFVETKQANRAVQGQSTRSEDIPGVAREPPIGGREVAADEQAEAGSGAIDREEASHVPKARPSWLLEEDPLNPFAKAKPSWLQGEAPLYSNLRAEPPASHPLPPPFSSYGSQEAHVPNKPFSRPLPPLPPPPHPNNEGASKDELQPKPFWSKPSDSRGSTYSFLPPAREGKPVVDSAGASASHAANGTGGLSSPGLAFTSVDSDSSSTSAAGDSLGYTKKKKLAANGTPHGPGHAFPRPASLSSSPSSSSSSPPPPPPAAAAPSRAPVVPTSTSPARDAKSTPPPLHPTLPAAYGNHSAPVSASASASALIAARAKEVDRARDAGYVPPPPTSRLLPREERMNGKAEDKAAAARTSASSHLSTAASGNSEFAALEQYIEDLTQEKFALQRALDAARALAESLAQENSALTDDFNNQGGVLAQLKEEIELKNAEIKAQKLVMASARSERERAVQECAAANERSQALAAEVIALEERVLKLRSRELKAERDLEALSADTHSQRRTIAALEKDRANLRSLISNLQEEKGVLQQRIRKATVGGVLHDMRSSSSLSPPAASSPPPGAATAETQSDDAAASSARSHEEGEAAPSSASLSSEAPQPDSAALLVAPSSSASPGAPDARASEAAASLHSDERGSRELHDVEEGQQDGVTHASPPPAAVAAAAAAQSPALPPPPPSPSPPQVQEESSTEEAVEDATGTAGAEPTVGRGDVEAEGDASSGGARSLEARDEGEGEGEGERDVGSKESREEGSHSGRGDAGAGSSRSLERVAAAMTAAALAAAASTPRSIEEARRSSSLSLRGDHFLAAHPASLEVLSCDEMQRLESINQLIAEIAEERQALARALETEAAASALLRASNEELSRKLAAQTQHLELTVARRNTGSAAAATALQQAAAAPPVSPAGTPSAAAAAAAAAAGIEYIDEGDEVAERMLGWILNILPGGRSKQPKERRLSQSAGDN